MFVEVDRAIRGFIATSLLALACSGKTSAPETASGGSSAATESGAVTNQAGRSPTTGGAEATSGGVATTGGAQATTGGAPAMTGGAPAMTGGAPGTMGGFTGYGPCGGGSAAGAPVSIGGGGHGGGDGTGAGGGPTISQPQLWLRGLAYGSGTFVAVGSLENSTEPGGVIYASKDGTDWQQVARDLPSAPVDVEFGNGRFVALGGTHAFVSTDGTSWQTSSTGQYVYRRFAFGNGVFLAGTRGAFLRSTNGTEWSVFGTAASEFDVEFLDGRFLAWASFEASRILTGNEAADAPAVFATLPGLGYVPRDIRVVDGKFRGLFLDDCCYGEVPSAIRWGVATSETGSDWQPTNWDLSWEPPLVLGETRSACMARGPRQLQVGPTCTTLSTVQLDADFDPQGVLYADGAYLAFGSYGILRSTDGVTWQRTLWMAATP